MSEPEWEKVLEHAKRGGLKIRPEGILWAGERLAELEQQLRWIPVSEGYPADVGPWETISELGERGIQSFFSAEKWDAQFITHYAKPRPSPPQQGELCTPDNPCGNCELCRFCGQPHTPKEKGE